VSGVAPGALPALNAAGRAIFDLRDNRAGFPDMVMLRASYLFRSSVYIQPERNKQRNQSWTYRPSPQSSVDKPGVILTIPNRRTSGADTFSYNMKC